MREGGENKKERDVTQANANDLCYTPNTVELLKCDGTTHQLCMNDFHTVTLASMYFQW